MQSSKTQPFQAQRSLLLNCCRLRLHAYLACMQWHPQLHVSCSLQLGMSSTSHRLDLHTIESQ